MQTTPERSATYVAGRPARIPNVQPFPIEPLLLARLNAFNAGRVAVTLFVVAVIGLAVVWTAASANLLFTPLDWRGIIQDVWSFMLLSHSGDPVAEIPFFRDYPSIVMTVTIGASVCLLYGLYRGAEHLHSDMEEAGCIKYSESGRISLTEAVNSLNRRLRRWGKFSPIAFVLALGFTTLTNLSLKDGLYGFLGDHLYEHWWASLQPLRPGGIVWVIFGALGIYMVYAEAVLGLTYVGFLKRLRNDYQFRANMFNPDGYYGWSRLRRAISNMQMGAVCTLFSAWALSYFLYPAAGAVATAIVLLIFTGIVGYVFFSVNVSFRKQAQIDKRAQRAEVVKEITDNFSRKDAEGLLLLLAAYKRLEYISRIPSAPIRQPWLLAGAVSVLGPLSAVAVQVVQYLTVHTS